MAPLVSDVRAVLDACHVKSMDDLVVLLCSPSLIWYYSRQRFSSSLQYTSTLLSFFTLFCRWSAAPAQVQRKAPAHHPSIPATNVIPIPDNLCVEAETFSYYFLEGYYIHPDLVAKYELGCELGVGGNGLVLQARRRSDGQEVAVKFVYKGDDTEH
ncbi:hypothetical protein BDY19DRAFT_991091 [Irpex rosettiformis]|uniref:Uncharacterized protein n=1 Tax=Irpex rosettiformis TaxID=378272 RepID=A0ACB8UDM2_9APHY|nr:hypothetical protein BDY19DRAFT_991091 [Irpex rosettiformis]